MTENHPQAPFRLVESGAIAFVGLKRHYDLPDTTGIPEQWQAFVPLIGTISGGKGNGAFGVIWNAGDDGGVDYLTGVEVDAAPSAVTAPLESALIPARTYAVFRHDGHVTAIPQSWNAAFGHWLPQAGLRCADAPPFERYGEGFDPMTGTGDIELWIPVIPK